MSTLEDQMKSEGDLVKGRFVFGTAGALVIAVMSVLFIYVGFLVLLVPAGVYGVYIFGKYIIRFIDYLIARYERREQQKRNGNT